MKLNHLLRLSLLSCVFSVKAFGQSGVQQIGNVSAVNINGQQVNLTLDNAEAQVIVYTPSVIRIRIDRKKLDADFSYAVTGKPLTVKTSIVQDDNQISVTTDSLKAVIQKKPFSIAFLTPEGKVISEDEKGLSTSWAGEAVTGYKKMQEWEHFVGLGEKTGPLDRKGNGYTNWNSDVFGYSVSQDPLYSTIPFYIGIHHG
ncbi:MAG: DUF4968 domain-containing protein, partial [Sphingobacteriales bacterium]